MTIGILGGGLTGIALRHFLGDAEVVEKDDVPGGLCRTFTKDGFSYDLGGHILFSKDEATLGLIVALLGDNAAKHFRRNYIRYRKRFVLYPFENGFPDLPIAERIACFMSFMARPRTKPRNFGEWISARFGRGIGKRYLVPYNLKIWKTPLDEISTGWVERVPDPPALDLLKGVLGIRTQGYLHQLHFYYPRRGGIQSLIAALAGGSGGIHTNFEVQSVRKTSDGWAIGDGERDIFYDRLVSTIPIPDLILRLEGVPSDVAGAAAGLKFNSLITVLVGARATKKPERFAVYFPQDDVIFHRVCFPGFLGSAYVPSGKQSMAAEITVPPDDRLLWRSDAEIADLVIGGLCKEGFLSRGDVTTIDVRRNKYAYVVDTHDRARRIETIKRFLNERGITILGRFAEFEYLNMDACVARARNLARAMGAERVT